MDNSSFMFCWLKHLLLNYWYKLPLKCDLSPAKDMPFKVNHGQFDTYHSFFVNINTFYVIIVALSCNHASNVGVVE